MTSKIVQPLAIAATGALAAATSIRTANTVLSLVLPASAALLPWTAERHEPAGPPA